MSGSDLSAAMAASEAATGSENLAACFTMKGRDATTSPLGARLSSDRIAAAASGLFLPISAVTDHADVGR